MVEQVVGLRFVTDGEREATASIAKFDRAQSALSSRIKVSVDSANKQSASLDRLSRDVMKVEREIRRLATAQSNGTITGGQFSGELNKMAARLKSLGLENAQSRVMKFGNTVSEATRELAQMNMQGVRTAGGVNRWSNQFVTGSNRAKRSTNSMGVAVQQTGYQVGDFLVQVQSGTNPLVAFGQQATQLVGVLPLVAGALGLTSAAAIGLSTVLGIGIPLITAIGAYFMRTSGSAKTFEDTVKDLDDAMQALSESNKSASMTTQELRDKYGSASVALRSTIDLLNQIARNEAQGAIDALSQSISELYNVRGGGERRSALADFFDVNIFLAFTDAQRESRSEARSLTAEFVRQQEVLANSNGNLEAQIGATRSLLSLAQALADTDGSRSSEEEQLIKLLAERLLGMQELLVLQEESTQAQRSSNYLMDEAVEKYNDIRTSAEDRISQYEREIALNQAILSYGEKSVQVEDLKRAQAMAVVEAMIEQEQLGDELAKKMRDAAAAAYDTSVAVSSINLSPALAQANAFADAMGRARSNASGIGISTAGINAQIAALESGASQVEARAQGAAETVRARLTAELPAADRGAKSSDRIDRVAQKTYEEELKKGIATERLQKLTATTSGGSSGSSGGGAAKSNVIDLQEIIAKRNEQIAQERVLLGLTGQQRAEMEIYYDLTKGMSDEQLASSEQFVMAEAKKIAALQQTNDVLKEQRDEQKQIADTISSSMGSAFMSIIDGTKSVGDAFKDMARAIIAELIQVLIVKRAVSAVTSFLGFADGGAFSNGSQISAYANGGAFSGGNVTAFANGGVVGGPTYFPMSGGKTGLMGEAGPEAIMPLKRGKDGKLGVAADGGGAVTVVQNFNFSANGDDSVKKIIAQAAPQIANMAKASLLDDRRRGGSTKAAFG